MPKLKQAMSLLTSLLATRINPISTYEAFRSELHERVKDHSHRLMMYQESVELNVDGSLNHIHPLSLTIVSGKNDTFHFHDAMQQPDREQFIEAMIKELKDHHINKHWNIGN